MDSQNQIDDGRRTPAAMNGKDGDTPFSRFPVLLEVCKAILLLVSHSPDGFSHCKGHPTMAQDNGDEEALSS